MAEAAPAVDEAAAGEPAAAESAISEEEVSALLEKSAASNVQTYDLTALRVNRSQLPMLEVVAKCFADRMGPSLSALLGREATVQFTALESGKAVELQAALPVPASLASVRLKPLAGAAFATVEPKLLLAMLDGFYGGTGRAAADPQAAISPSALRFLGMLLRAVAADWTAAWSPVTPLDLELVKQETNPRLMQLGEPQLQLLVLKFTVEFGAQSGRIDLLIPEPTLAPIRESLAADGPSAPVRRSENWVQELSVALLEAEFETRAVLTETEISLRSLVRLAPGDIIPIDPPDVVGLLVGDVCVYRGRFGVSQGRNALTVLPGGPA